MAGAQVYLLSRLGSLGFYSADNGKSEEESSLNKFSLVAISVGWWPSGRLSGEVEEH